MTAGEEYWERALRKVAVALIRDPELRLFPPEIVALVAERTISLFNGAGTWLTACERMIEDSELAALPEDVVTAIAGRTLFHWARVLETVKAEV